MTRNNIDHRTTRRAFLGGTAALATYAALPRSVFGADAAKPNSVFNGVRIGCTNWRGNWRQRTRLKRSSSLLT